MVVYPNKPLIFGVDHEEKAVNRVVPLFKRTIQGKKFLYVELTFNQLITIPEYAARVGAQTPLRVTLLNQTGAYGKLIKEALRLGLTIVPLDTPKLVEGLQEAKLEELFTGVPHRGSVKRMNNLVYGDREKREKAWERVLRPVGSDSVILLPPTHARKIIKVLGIPRQNIAHLGRIHDFNLELQLRSISRDEQRRIEERRIVRRLNRAKNRARQVSRERRTRL